MYAQDPFAQKQQALGSLAKHLGLFSDDAPVSQTFILQQINNLVDDRAVIRIREAESAGWPAGK